MEYNFREIEQKWQQYWIDQKTYKTDINPAKVIAIVDTSNGLKIVVASSDKLVPRAIRELAKQEGMEILEGTGHAEATILNEVTKRGWNLKAIAPSRDFCANCWSRSLATDAEIMGVLKDRAFSGKKK